MGSCPLHVGAEALVQDMKIGFVYDPIYEYALGSPRKVGGAELQQWLLARALVAAGWSVIVGVQKALVAGERNTIDGVQFVGIGDSHILLARYRFLISERPDWWYWRCADHWWGPSVLIAGAAGVRTIFAAAFDSDVQPRRALYRHPRLWPLYALGLKRSDRIFLQHTAQLSKLPRQWCSKAHIVPNIAGETQMGKPHSERKKYVAWVGILRQPKRADLLIKIAQKAPTINFVVCGGIGSVWSPPGYSKRIIEELSSLSNVEYLGLVEPKRAQEVIAESAILLSTADEEGFPNTFLQAWSSGTPIVSLTVDPDRLIQRKGLGAVSGNVEGAVADINALLQSPQRRNEIAVRARQHVDEVHSAPVVTKVFDGAIRARLDAKKLGPCSRENAYRNSCSEGTNRSL